MGDPVLSESGAPACHCSSPRPHKPSAAQAPRQRPNRKQRHHAGTASLSAHDPVPARPLCAVQGLVGGFHHRVRTAELIAGLRHADAHGDCHLL